MVDVFDEVDEQIRAERFRALIRRIVPFFIAAMVVSILAVLGVWGFSRFSTGAVDKAAEAYAGGMDLLEKATATAPSPSSSKRPKGRRATAACR